VCCSHRLSPPQIQSFDASKKHGRAVNWILGRSVRDWIVYADANRTPPLTKFASLPPAFGATAIAIIGTAKIEHQELALGEGLQKPL